MADAFIDSATNAATGHPKENLIDWNPDTYWKATGVGTVNFVIDLGSAKTIQGWALWLHNGHIYLDPGPGYQDINVYYSTDKSTWTLWDTKHLTKEGNQQALFINYSVLTPQSKRYWKIEVVAPDLVVEISMVFLYTKYSITQGNQTPEQSSQGYAVRAVESASGRVFTTLQRLNKREKLSRTYLFCTAGDWESLPLVLAFNDCKGNWRPLILVEDNLPQYAKLVRFAQSEIPRTVESYQVYRPTVVFVTESFITLGQAL